MATVMLLGTLDTKGAEYAFLRERILASGCDVLLVDCGVMSTSPLADVSADEVAAAAGEDRAALAAAGDRGPAVAAMTRGAIETVRRLHAEGRFDAILGIGGSGGSSFVSATGVAGFFGASSMERLPTEVAITENMKRFKKIGRGAA